MYILFIISVVFVCADANVILLGVYQQVLSYVPLTRTDTILLDSVVNAPNVNTFKNRLDIHWREEYFLYNYEDRPKRYQHVGQTIEANACGHV